tara:strand:+ start:705 stop:1079 length:375 start_codon:yes stop_codon:yes gene_type:complete
MKDVNEMTIEELLSEIGNVKYDISHREGMFYISGVPEINNKFQYVPQFISGSLKTSVGYLVTELRTIRNPQEVVAEFSRQIYLKIKELRKQYPGDNRAEKDMFEQKKKLLEEEFQTFFTYVTNN